MEFVETQKFVSILAPTHRLVQKSKFGGVNQAYQYHIEVELVNLVDSAHVLDSCCFSKI